MTTSFIVTEMVDDYAARTCEVEVVHRYPDEPGREDEVVGSETEDEATTYETLTAAVAAAVALHNSGTPARVHRVTVEDDGRLTASETLLLPSVLAELVTALVP